MTPLGFADNRIAFSNERERSTNSPSGLKRNLIGNT